MNQFMENPPNSVLFLQYGPSVQEFLELTASNSTGVIYNMLGGAIDSKKEVKTIRKRYEEEYGHPGGYFAVVAYDQVMITPSVWKKSETQLIVQPSANVSVDWKRKRWPAFLPSIKRRIWPCRARNFILSSSTRSGRANVSRLSRNIMPLAPSSFRLG